VSEKSEGAFRTIGEVADSLDLPQHVLRFWETRFKEIEPVKRAGGRRYYRPRDVELLAAIRHLLYGKGYTIKGVQRILKEQGTRAVIEGARSGGQEPDPQPPVFGKPASEAETVTQLETRPVPVAVANEPPVFPNFGTVAARAATEAPPTRLDENDRRQLEEALQQIAECQRLLTLTRH
jgi:DNA-binding transcriptional MerR regulator